MASNDGDAVQKNLNYLHCQIQFWSPIFYQHSDSLLEITGNYWITAILSLNIDINKYLETDGALCITYL